MPDKCEGCTDCAACVELQRLFPLVGCSMIAPWRCKCLRHEFAPVRKTKQKNIYGCCGALSSRTLKLTGRQITFCECDR